MADEVIGAGKAQLWFVPHTGAHASGIHCWFPQCSFLLQFPAQSVEIFPGLYTSVYRDEVSHSVVITVSAKRAGERDRTALISVKT